MRRSLVLTVMLALAAGCASHETARTYPYDNPLNSPGGKFGALPLAVQMSIRAEAGKAEIYDIQKIRHSSPVVYQILFKNSAVNPPLYVGADGSVLNPDLSVAVGAGEDTALNSISSGAGSGGLKFSDLPMEVANTVQRKAPTAEVAHINKVTVNGQVVFEVSFKDEFHHPKMLIAEDGTLATAK